MFQPLQTEVMERFTAVRQHFRASRHFRNEPSQTAKGLVFVEVYAIWEYVITKAVPLTAEGVASAGYALSELKPSLQALFLHNEIQSIRAVHEKKVWGQSLTLFERATSADTANVAAYPIPFDGSHFRHSQLQLIFKVFGITRKPTTRPRHLFRITEVVDLRNSIAHGEETAAAVGRRFSRADIGRIVTQMERTSLRVIYLLSEHCSKNHLHCR